MRAILLLLTIVAGCGSSSGPNKFELDIAVNAPNATSALIDGTAVLPPVGGVFSRGFPSASDAANVTGTIATIGSDGSVRASAAYSFGTFCATIMPLLRQTERFVEGTDASGAPTLTLDSVECERTDGSGTVVTP